MTIKNVIESGNCIGCGACASISPAIKITFNGYGDLVAALPEKLSSEEIAKASEVCPFAGGPNEDEISAEIFKNTSYHQEVGHYLTVQAAYSVRDRASGSSGGIATWVLSRLIQRGLVDGVIHVAPRANPASERFFEYKVSSTIEEVKAGSTSFYYPVSMDSVIDIIKSRPGRYAITGVPCFHKALRLLRRQDPIINERVIYQVGIVCGQMKSAHYLEFLAGHAGANRNIESACFRRKVDGLPANDYAFEARGTTGDDKSEIKTWTVLNSKIGANWGMGYFKPKACDYCDDVLAETADIAVMDAWLPRYVKDGAGWSLLVTRTAAMQNIIAEGAAEQELKTDSVTVDEVADSQRGGLNHRRDALGYRLWLSRDGWNPRKRTTANPDYPFIHKIEQRARMYLRESSRKHWIETGHAGNFNEYKKRMYLPEMIYKIITRIKRIKAFQ